MDAPLLRRLLIPWHQGDHRRTVALRLVLCLGLVGLPSVAAPSAGGAPAWVAMPNPALTPGEAFKGVTVQQLCTPGYTMRVRAVSEITKRAVYRRYGITHPAPGAYEIDHLISLELGGDNSVRNLWPEPYAGPAGAHQKDGLENYLHAQVCAGQEPLARAQHDIATNWYAAWIAAGRPTGTMPYRSRTGRPTGTTHVQHQGGMRVAVTITPSAVPYGSYPTLSVQTAPRATCAIEVVYSTGRQPTSYSAHTTQADGVGRIVEHGQWHMESKGTSGVATVTCTVGARTSTGQRQFAIVKARKHATRPRRY